MKDAILIKGNRFGLTIILDDKLDFNIIKEKLFNKLNESKRFFGKSKVTIAFKGRNLTQEETDELVDVINRASDLEIVCVIDDSEQAKECVDYDRFQDKKTAIFHKGTLRSGQELVSDSSIIIMGNINYGAKVIAKGNIIVIGKLNGSVYAGEEGNSNSFVVALNMNPTQIRINETFGILPDKKARKIKSSSNPQIAFIKEDKIIIENINRNIYNSLII